MSDKIKIQDLPHYTLEDYKHWEGKWELIRGIPYAMSPSPSRKHQNLASKINAHLHNQLEECSECEVYHPIDIIIDSDTVLQPDLVILCGEEIEAEEPVPSLVVEIQSPSTAMKDRSIKFKLYEQFGIKYYWMVEPDKKWVEIYELRERKYVRLESNPHMAFDLGHCQFEFNFQKIW